MESAIDQCAVLEDAAIAMTMYEVKLVNSRGLVATLQVAREQYILEVAAASGLELPTLCHLGNCPSCIGVLVEGEVDQSLQSYLTAAELEIGLILLCVARPRSDCTIKTHLIN